MAPVWKLSVVFMHVGWQCCRHAVNGMVIITLMVFGVCCAYRAFNRSQNTEGKQERVFQLRKAKQLTDNEFLSTFTDF